MKSTKSPALDALAPTDRALVEAYVATQHTTASVSSRNGFTHYLRITRPTGEQWLVHIHPDEFAFQLVQKDRFFGHHITPDKEVHFWPIELAALVVVLRERAAQELAMKGEAA